MKPGRAYVCGGANCINAFDIGQATRGDLRLPVFQTTKEVFNGAMTAQAVRRDIVQGANQ